MYFTLHACTHRARRGVPTPHGLQIYSHDPITCTAHWHIHAGKRGAPAPCTHSTEHLCIHIGAPKGRASPPQTQYPASCIHIEAQKGRTSPPPDTQYPAPLYSHVSTKGARQPCAGQRGRASPVREGRRLMWTKRRLTMVVSWGWVSTNVIIFL